MRSQWLAYGYVLVKPGHTIRSDMCLPMAGCVVQFQFFWRILGVLKLLISHEPSTASIYTLILETLYRRKYKSRGTGQDPHDLHFVLDGIPRYSHLH